jgi:translocator protein
MNAPAELAPPHRSPLISGLALVGFIALCFSAAALGAFFPPDAWYAGLNKPSWNPPAWVFGPVWTALYLGMACAAWRVWRLANVRVPLALFAVHLLLNAAWSPLFFGAHALGLAFLEIVVLWIAIATTGAVFYRRDRVAGLLFVPYLAWVSFAAVLNAVLWRLNV